jgi:predicted nucleic acid-binding protein
MQKYVFDTYAWIEYFLGSEKGKTVKELVENPKDRIYTPEIVLFEMSRKYMREGYSADETERRISFVLAKSRTVPFEPALAVNASQAFTSLEEKARKEGRRSPGLVDGILKGSGEFLGAKIVTGDEHFEGLADVLFLK